MGNVFRIYAIVEEKGVTENGGVLQWDKGCDGVKHVDCLDVVFYGDDGAVEYASQLTIVDRGPCDKTCTAANHGSFICPQPTPSRRGESS